MSFPTDKTTKDLSDTEELQAFPAYFASMAGGNMVSDKNPYFSGQGSGSEATYDIESTQTDWIGYSHNPEILPGPKTPESQLDTDDTGSSYTPKPLSWKEL